jgi:hypothetical protein
MDEPSQSEDRKLSAMEHVKKRHEEKGFLYAWSVRSQQYNLDVLDKRCSASAESAQSYVFRKHQNKFTHSFVGCIMLNTDFFSLLAAPSCFAAASAATRPASTAWSASAAAARRTSKVGSTNNSAAASSSYGFVVECGFVSVVKNCDQSIVKIKTCCK